MIKPQKIIIIFLLFCLFPKTQVCIAQSAGSFSELEEKLDEAQALMDAFQNDPAISILQSLEDTLELRGEINSEFGLKVQDKFAEALEREDRDELAIAKLISLSEETKVREIWSVYANTQLSLARLHEKLGRSENCLKHLRLSANVIEDYGVNEHYPRYAVRISSYHRLFGERDSSIYYAHEAIRSSNELGQVAQVGTGHLLLGLLLFRESYDQTKEHFETAGKIWYEMGDFSGYSYIQNNLAKLHNENGRKDLAMLHNDSTLIAAKLTEEMGHDHRPILLTAYHFRSKLYEQLGRLDSSLYYSKIAYSMELDEAISFNDEKIIEIDAKYNDELKSQTIKEQHIILASEKQRRRLLWGLFFMFLFFSTILSFAYLRLLSANNKIKNQNFVIKKTNTSLKKSLEQSQVLQSELHHRVKNNMQVIIGLIELQSDNIDDASVKQKLESMTQRIYSMAATHDAFNVNNYEEELKLVEFINIICQNFELTARSEQFKIIKKEIGDLKLSLDTLMPMGMILHELLTNSVKHFDLTHEILKISIQLHMRDGYISLIYKDNGPGFEKDKMQNRKGGLGNYLINSMVRQLNGHWETKSENGAVTSIYLKEKIEHES